MKYSFMKIAIILTIVVSMAGCATVQVKHPGIDSVKKIAVVSVTSNYEIRNMDDKTPATSGKDLTALGKDIGKALTKDLKTGSMKAQVAITTHGAAETSTMFSHLGGWSLVTIADVMANPSYKEMVSVNTGADAKGVVAKVLAMSKDSAWVAPEGMAVIPFTSVIPASGTMTVTYVNGKAVDPTKDVLASLGALCTKLGVDAVAVVEVKLSYKATLLTNASGSGLFAKVRGSAKPAVEVNVAVVDAQGHVVMNSTPGWATSVGKSAPMMLGGAVDLMDDKGESVLAYNATIDESVKALSANIAKVLK